MAAGELADAAQLVARDPAPASVCSARARRPARRSGQCTAIRPPAGISSSGQRSCRFQRRSLISRVRVRDQALAVVDEQADVELEPGELRDRERVDPFADRGPGDRDRVDRVGLAALARRCSRAPAVSFGATRTTRSPRASRNRSSAPETWRQSSIAHTRSPPRRRAQRNRSSNERRFARTVRSARSRGRALPRAPRRCARPCACPSRSRSSAPSLQLGISKNGSPVDTSQSGRCHAPIKSGRGSSGGG